MKIYEIFRNQSKTNPEPIEENISTMMPPNILILRRKSVRQFPDHTMVALYHNDKFNLDVSIPYGTSSTPVVTPVKLEEANTYRDRPGKAQWMAEFEKHVVSAEPKHAGKIDWDSAHHFYFQKHTPKDAADAYVRNRIQLPEETQPGITHVADHEKGKFHKTLLKHGFLHHSSTFSDNISPVTTHHYIHPSHGRSHVDVMHFHKGGNESWIHRHEQSNGIVAPYAHGETKPRLDKHLGEIYGPNRNKYMEETITSLRKIAFYECTARFTHEDGQKTIVEPAIAKTLLGVYDSLNEENRNMFAGKLSASPQSFMKMLTFAKNPKN